MHKKGNKPSPPISNSKDFEQLILNSKDFEQLTFEDAGKNKKGALEKTATRSVKFDFWAKIVVFVAFIAYVVWQVYSVNSSIHSEMMLPIGDRLPPAILTTYIKYSLGFNSALILILGYWFGSSGGFSKLIHHIASSIVDRKSE